MSAERTTTIAFIGLGRMGRPMAARLLAVGYLLRVADLDAGAVRALTADGAEPYDDARAAADGADMVITMLPDGPAVESVAFGAAGLVDGWVPDRLWIEMSSSLPATTRAVADAIAARGGLFLDAPVSGGVRGASTGTLTIMAAGAPTTLARARPVLEAMGSTVIEVGAEPGLGDLVKSLNNLLSAINLTAAAEAVELARRGGLSVEKLIEVVSSSTGASNAMTVKVGQFAAQDRFDAGFTIDQYRKDLNIALHEAAGAPIAERTREVWDALARDGHGGEDHTRVVPLVAARMPAITSTARTQGATE